jgi:hypothetical protein
MSRSQVFSSLTFLALPTLVSCIAAQTEFMGPNGKTVYAISCQTLEDCATHAREFCPNGHDIVPAAFGASNTTAKGGIGDAPERRMLIECKGPPP